MSKIKKLDAFEILDSRGNPTVQVRIELENGVEGIAKIPSGASTGTNEAVELRDGDPKRFGGKGVLRAVSNVVDTIQPAVKGMDASDQRTLDQKLIELDGTANKARLGANAILGVSLASARASAADRKLPLYAYLTERDSYIIPVPMLNVLNGGAHADNNVDFQEFMIAPVGAPTFADALRSAAETFQSLKETLKRKNYSTGVGDEGGFAPQLRSNEEAMELLDFAIQKAGYSIGGDIAINLDPATSGMWKDDAYHFKKSGGGQKSSDEMIGLWTKWLKDYPEIYSIEDGLAEDDWAGWKKLTDALGSKVQIVGDDIFVTNPKIFERGIRERVANSVLIKLNQIGTLTETFDCIEMAKKAGYTAVVSHRSGETDDAFIADLTVATGVGQIKTGSVCRGERVAKYNRLLEIERELGSKATYAGTTVYERWRSVATR